MKTKPQKRILTLALALIFALGLAPLMTVPAMAAAPTPDTSWYVGDGPYEISTAEELAGLAKLVNDETDDFSGKTITLTADIDLSDYDNWVPIGDNSTYNNDTRFLGTLEGGGHVITNLKVNLTGVGINFAGLFGVIGSGGEIKNLGISGGSVTASGGYDNYAGGVAGYNIGGAITNCYNTGDVTASGGTYNYAGGVAGGNGNGGTITSCYNTGDVTAKDGTGDNYAGGVAGYNMNGTITNCYNTGDVAASGIGINNAGGVAGYNDGGEITNCYNTGAVTAIGGTYNYAGGVAGGNMNGTITSCYFLENTVTPNQGVGNGDGSGTTSLTLAEMTDADALDAGRMSDLGGAFVATADEIAACGCGAKYYLQLKVFADSADTFTKQMSRLSVLAVESGEQPFLTGDGTSAYPYEIATPGQLSHVRRHLEAGTYFKLTRDIDLSGIDWTPIGDNSTFDYDTQFLGTLDGGGHVITNLTVNLSDPGTNYAGLFGYIGSGGVVKDLGIVGGSVTASGSSNNYAGGVAGHNYGEITNCYNTGAVTADGSFTAAGLFYQNYAGGLAGRSDGAITNCYNTGAVTAKDGSHGNYAGGLAGVSDGAITNCYNTGAVTASGGGSSNYAGGVAGYNNTGAITNCYNTGAVTASDGYDSNAGGVAGWSGGGITNCYNTGAVAANGGTNNYAGGVAGRNVSGTITGCYRWAGAVVTGDDTYSEDGDELSAHELLTQATYTTSGWIFDVDNWTWDETYNYPKLGFGPETYPFSFTEFTVTITGGGTGASGGGEYYDGETVNIDAGSRSGYTFNGWTSDDIDVDTDLDDADSEQTFFTMPDDNVTVTANWTYNGGGYYPDPGPGPDPDPDPDDEDDVPAFTDIEGHWAEFYIRELALRGYVKGAGGGLFNPNGTLTRAQFAQALYNIVTGEGAQTLDAASGFEDLAPGAWYADAVDWAVQNGIMNGYSPENFGPEDSITREQMAAVIYRASALLGVKLTGDGTPDFADAAEISGYAKEAVAALYEAGIINGKPGNLFDPQGTATRAEMAKVLYLLLEYAGVIKG